MYFHTSLTTLPFVLSIFFRSLPSYISCCLFLIYVFFSRHSLYNASLLSILPSFPLPYVHFFFFHLFILPFLSFSDARLATLSAPPASCRPALRPRPRQATKGEPLLMSLRRTIEFEKVGIRSLRQRGCVEYSGTNV